jgi:hypothetical protein
LSNLSGNFMKHTLLALFIASAAGASMAQQGAYATIKSVEGLVTITSGNQLSNATKDMPLPRGAQVLSTSSGVATVVFSNGCEVTLKPGQSLLIEETACAIFLAQGGGAVAVAGLGLLTPTTVALTSVLGLGTLYDQNQGRPAVVRPPVSGS